MRAERRTELVDLLRATPRRLEVELRGMARADLLWTPAPGRWSILEVVCHLRDAEAACFLDTYRRIAAGECPVFPAFDADLAALSGLYREQRLSAALREWKQRRRETLALVENAAESLDLAAVLERHAEHDRTHLRQIGSIQERRAILTRLGTTPRELRALLEALPPARAAGPAADASLEVVAGLRDFEQRMLGRYARILEQERPELVPFDAVSLVARRGGASLAESRREFERLRSLTLELLHALGPRLWQRRGVHPHRGDLSIADLVTQHVDHDAAGFAALRAAAAAPPGPAPALRPAVTAAARP